MRDKWLTPDAPGSGYICRTLRIPNGEEFLAVVNGALLDLSYPWNWEKFGGLFSDETADLFATMYLDYRESRGCVLGTIFTHALATAPAGSLACDGATFLRVDYPTLYAVLDAAYIIDADHARTPDLRGRSAVGVGQGSGLTDRVIDASGGTETHVLTTAELPSHSHTYRRMESTAILIGPTPSIATVASTLAETFNTGGGGAHNNMHPFRALNYAIWAV